MSQGSFDFGASGEGPYQDRPPVQDPRGRKPRAFFIVSRETGGRKEYAHRPHYPYPEGTRTLPNGQTEAAWTPDRGNAQRFLSHNEAARFARLETTDPHVRVEAL